MTTSTNLLKVAYLREQRAFPTDDVKLLAKQMDQTYIDIASKVNSRSIGQYPVSFYSISGDKWYFAGGNQYQQSLRQVFTFSSTGNIPHGLNWSSVSLISPNSYGTFTDGTNWYGAIYAGSTAIAGQVTFYVTPTNIVVVGGAGAPAITSGSIVLEYVSLY